jgi:crotonobetainyl-CoA hydratase
MIDGRVPHVDAAWAQSEREGAALMLSGDATEGPLAFAQKRAPEWKAR